MMELAAQIKQHRNRMGWSQEELAEKAFVSRQTISNWENDKSYPDIQSLLLLSTLFDVSLDQLVKGDVETMKQQTQSEEVQRFKRMGTVFAVMFIIIGISSIPLLEYLGTIGIVIWVLLVCATLVYGVYIERWKNQHNIRTFREILAFMEGKPVDEIRSERQLKKELVLKLLAGAVAGLVLAILGALFFSFSR